MQSILNQYNNITIQGTMNCNKTIRQHIYQTRTHHHVKRNVLIQLQPADSKLK